MATPHDGIAKFVLSGPGDSAMAVLDPTTGKALVAARLQIRYGTTSSLDRSTFLVSDLGGLQCRLSSST